MSQKSEFAPSRLSKEELENEIEYYKLHLKVRPNDLAVIRNYAINLQKLNKPQEAIKFYDRALQLDPRNVDLFCDKGEAFLQMKYFDEAKKMFDISLSIDQKCKQAHKLKGCLYEEEGDFRRAVICYNIALSIDPKYESAISLRSSALRRLGNFEECIKSFNQLSLDSPLAYFNLLDKGHVYRENKHFVEAIECFDLCMSLNTRYSCYKTVDVIKRALEGKFVCLIDLCRNEDAIVVVDKLIDLHEKHAEYESELCDNYYNKGSLFSALKSYDQTIYWFNKAMSQAKTDHKKAFLFERISNCYLNMNKLVEFFF